MVGQRVVVAGQLFADQHEIDFQAPQVPEGVRDQNFPHDFDVAQVANHDHDNRQVAGDALPPERMLSFDAAAESRGRRPQLGLRKENERGELLKGLHIAGANVQPAHLELSVGPGGFESARAGVKVRITLGQRDDRCARIRHHRDERKLKALIRQHRDLSPQAEDRIEHGPDTFR